jgi:rubredoxin
MDENLRCPDCDVTLRPVTIQAGGMYTLFAVAETDGDGGVLDSFSPDERHGLEEYACPECGLVRSYVPTEAL